MYRLLIVDDEPNIVNGLMHQFQEMSELELDVCKAYSASEALDIAGRTKIDVVISDIRMPGRSGLDLAEDFLYYWPSCRFIILTGYSEFDYVYTAIQKNVDSYILKSDGMEPILDAVKAAVVKIEEANRNRDLLEKARQQWKATEPLLKKEFFEALLQGEPASSVIRYKHFDELTIPLDPKEPVLMIAGKVDMWEETASYSSKLDVFGAIQNLFAGYLPAAFKIESAVMEHSVLVWFIQPAADAAKLIEDGDSKGSGLLTYLKAILEPVQNDSKERHGISASFAICGGAVAWDSIGKEFVLLKTALQQSRIFGQRMAVIDLGMPDGLTMWESGKPPASSHDFNNRLDRLDKYLGAGDEREASEMTGQLIGDLKRDISVNYMTGIERYYKFLAAYISHVNGTNAADNSQPDIRLPSIPAIGLPAEWEAMEEQFIELSLWVCRRNKEQAEKRENIVVERIHKFVGENLGGDLSLARIAEAVYFNPSYLSRFYKQLSGRNLSEYINATKAKAASQMLADMNLKVNEIALKLGFDSPSYFTAFFRKMTGTSPQEYREALLERR
ncbi:response regulator transcription factor [Cohnella luojiensis]|uniref:Helix-turn-helix domain-containing protein n=1 Tax=Cohnella luojiensis TaxID=652876 RepID=A0A4Y8LXT2_9BACL|nr:helix-turn-helix domain-containing protein [Cohnella luojiensis]TFE24708.1 helix-turn-helix domain-containing protein [Cohnella luojiensis]